MRTFRVKSPEVDAVRFDGGNQDEINRLVGTAWSDVTNSVWTWRGRYEFVNFGDYVVRDAAGNIELLKEAEFGMRFEEIENGR